MEKSVTTYQRHRFPPEIISHAIWLYYRFTLSYRDVKEMLAQRGITVISKTIGYWCRKSGPSFARSIRQRQRDVSEQCHGDEVFLKIKGQLFYLFRAVDQEARLGYLASEPTQQTRGVQVLS